MKCHLRILGVLVISNSVMADPGWGPPPMAPGIVLSPPVVVLPQVMIPSPVIALPSVPLFGPYGRYEPEWRASEGHEWHHGHRHHHRD